MAKQHPEEWRSPCPVSRLLEIVGDKWSLLVVRDLLLGKSRFKDFITSPEGIPTNILTQRLQKLAEHGIIEKKPVAEGARRCLYVLTPKGEDLRPVLRTMVDWSLRHEEGTRLGLVPEN